VLATNVIFIRNKTDNNTPLSTKCLYRVTYKVAKLIHKALNGDLSPPYIQTLVTFTHQPDFYVPPRATVLSLREPESKLVNVHSSTQPGMECSINNCAVKNYLKSFKAAVKTDLFITTYTN